MMRLQHIEKLDSPSKPHQYFDLIAGSGTGAIQACMLGRLHMSVHEAIDSYAKLAKEVFSERKWIGQCTFRTTKLKDSLKNTIHDVTGNSDEPMMDSDSTAPCGTLVFAMSRHNMRGGIPTAFRSYVATANEGPQCTIWESLCATMAHPELFKSFDIGGPILKQSFVDAGFGCNNPLAHVLEEVKRLHPGRHVSTILSIGTGHTSTIQIPDGSVFRQFLPTAAIGAMKGITEDAEKVAEEMAKRFNSTDGIYFRLSVDQGLQSIKVDKWDQLDEVAEHTHAYMKIQTVTQTIDKAAESIHLRRNNLPAVQINGEIQVAIQRAEGPGTLSTIRRCPAPSPMFAGCEHKLRMTESCIMGVGRELKVCIVHGLGGAGKTQMVLKVIERTYDKWKEIIYIDASTRESIEAGLQEVATAKKLGDTHRSTLQWLESYREPWLLVLDNADNPSVSIRDYIPRGNHGSVIITTRLSGMATLARGQNSECNISSMDPEDALNLLLKCARLNDQKLSPKEEGSSRELVKELGYFALAIVQAGSFIGHSPHMSITRYRSLLGGEQRSALEAYRKLPAAVKADSYGHTVYTTWLMCYNGIGPLAQQLLWLIAHLHHTGITVDIFRRAAISIVAYNPRLPTTKLENLAQKKLQKFLGAFINSEGEWEELLFAQVINEIVSRSLLEYDRMNQAYRIHALVQDWVRTVVPYEHDLAAKCAEMLLSISVGGCTDDTMDAIVFRMSIGLHIDKVVWSRLERVGAEHALNFSRVYASRGQWRQAEQLQIIAQKALRQALGDEHPDTLTSMHEVGRARSHMGQYEDARAIHAQVLRIRKRVLGSDHLDTLETMNNVAIAYSHLGRSEDARALHVQVLHKRRRVLGSDHPDTLATMNNIAIAYSYLGRYEDARALHTQVRHRRERVLGRDHPDTLATMNNLANAYSYLGRHEDARALHTQVLRRRERVLGRDHPDTLRSMNNLANSYIRPGRYGDARTLYIQVLQRRERVLGSDHPDTLATMNNLANAYSNLGRYDDARALYAQVLDARKRVLGSDHRDTLSAINKLAKACSHLGRYDDPRALSAQVLNTRKRVPGSDHPDTLTTTNTLRQSHPSLRGTR
ncbi:Patatin-like phospholipase, partial [Rhizoctonia solani]